MAEGRYHRVQAGECVSSIADRYGQTADAIWSHANNEGLKDLRPDPNVLAPGDRVFVPETEAKTQSLPTNQKHSLRVTAATNLLRVRVCVLDEPVANASFELTVDGGDPFEGQTDGDGLVEAAISPKARRGVLRIPDHGLVYDLDLGQLDPIDELEGVQARLNNLGFFCGRVDGKLGPRTRSALVDFQSSHELDESGEPDDDTKDKLTEAHGS